MNCVTGKFGQKSHPTSTTIYSTMEEETEESRKQFEAVMDTVVDFEPIFGLGDGKQAMMVECNAKTPHPSYPIYLSGQILAYARVYMSSIYRQCNAYLDPAMAMSYTDTDSLVLPAKAAAILALKGYVGNELGQLGCDLDDHFDGTHFAKIIRGVWAAPKGNLFIFLLNIF